MDDQELKSQISQVVDRWVSDVLKSRFIERPYGEKPKSLWDKFKQGVTNWWWGPKGEKYNPYRWKNRFGDELGVSESFSPSVFTLHEYRDIRGIVDSVETTLNESEDEFDKLRLMKIVRSAADRLKDMLFDVLKGKVFSPPSAAPENKSRGGASAEHMDVPEKKNKAAGSERPSVSGEEGKPVEPPAPAPAAARNEPSTPMSAEKPEKETRVSSTKADPKAPSNPPSEGEKEVEKPVAAPEEETKQGQEGLIDYIQAKGKLKDFLKALNDTLPSVFESGMASEKQNEIKNWFLKKKEEAKSKEFGNMNAGDRIKALQETMDSFVKEIASIVEIDQEKMRLMMASYLKDGRIRGDLLTKKKKKDEGQEDQIDEGLGLESYVFDGDKRISLGDAIKRLDGFMEDPLAIQGVSKSDERVARLKDWWSEEKKSIEEKSDKLEYIESALMSTEYYLKKIGMILGKTPQVVKGLMTKHIQKKSNR